LLAVLCLGWLPGHARDARSDSLAPASTDSSALASAIEKLDQRLARIEASLAVRDSRGEREAVRAPEAASKDGAPRSSALDVELERISQAIDQLAQFVQQKRKPAFSMPTLEQIHRARRDVDWEFVDSVRALCKSDDANESAQALERVRLMTFDDLLRKVGIPPTIRVTDDGAWIYQHMVLEPDGLDEQGIQLFFVGDTVTGVSAF
jgi:hypothetical protein